MQLLRCFYPVQDPKIGLRPCGMCANCMLVKHLQWKFRLTQEVLHSDLALWLTLQYDDEYLPLIDGRPSVQKKDPQNFFRKLRKQIKEEDLKVTFKYFLVAEYGPKTNRPHYHCLLLLRLPEVEIKPMLELRQKVYEACKARWYHGNCYEKLFHSGVIRYLTKYVFKPSSDFDPPAPLFRLISKGIGEDYLNNILRESVLHSGWRTPEGIIPRYYRDKLYPTRNKDGTENHLNKELRKIPSSVRWNELYRKLDLDRKKCRSLDEYIKKQQYLLRCQLRQVERKQKEKYG